MLNFLFYIILLEKLKYLIHKKIIIIIILWYTDDFY